MRILTAVVTALSLLAIAHAAGGEDKGKPLGGADTTVELPMLVAPVTVNGRLYHYAYMRVLLEASDMTFAAQAREKVPFIIDAMLRETHRESIALGGDPDTVDGDGLKTRLLGAARAVVGDKAFVSLTFRDTIQTDNPAANQSAEKQPAPETEPAPASH